MHRNGGKAQEFAVVGFLTFSFRFFAFFAFFDFLTSTTSFSVQASDCAKG